MKRKLFITLILTIVLSISLVVPVSAEGMDGRNRLIYPCVISRGYGFAQYGIPHGMYGCLTRPAARFEFKHRW